MGGGETCTESPFSGSHLTKARAGLLPQRGQRMERGDEPGTGRFSARRRSKGEKKGKEPSWGKFPQSVQKFLYTWVFPAPPPLPPFSSGFPRKRRKKPKLGERERLNPVRHLPAEFVPKDPRAIQLGRLDPGGSQRSFFPASRLPPVCMCVYVRKTTPGGPLHPPTHSPRRKGSNSPRGALTCEDRRGEEAAAAAAPCQSRGEGSAGEGGSWSKRLLREGGRDRRARHRLFSPPKPTRAEGRGRGGEGGKARPRDRRPRQQLTLPRS